MGRVGVWHWSWWWLISAHRRRGHPPDSGTARKITGPADDLDGFLNLARMCFGFLSHLHADSADSAVPNAALIDYSISVQAMPISAYVVSLNVATNRVHILSKMFNLAEDWGMRTVLSD
jgi:hypothetical protein